MISQPSKNRKKQKPPDWLVENIAEASKNARKIYLLYITFLAYCALSVAGTSDRQIILNESVRLPLINADVSVIGFFLVAPLMAIFLFVYLQLYLSRIHGLITDLRTNYAPIEKRRLYPWLLNIAEDPEPGFIGKLQRGIPQCSLWWLLPTILMLFAFWFVKTHDPVLSYVVGMLPIGGTLVVFYFWSHYEGSQYKSRSRIIQVLGFLFKGKGKVTLASIVLAFEIILLCFLIPWAASGGKYPFLKPWICVDLSYQVFVTKLEEGHPNIYWAKLKEAHLEGADFTSTVLTGAELRGAKFQGAIFTRANLQGVDFDKADLEGAYFNETDLREVINLKTANLQGADLWKANLQGADLQWANLQWANLQETNLREAELSGATLRGAILWKANLQGADLQRADLQWANLQGADLRGADLWKANLQGADLRGADFQWANLQETDLRGVRSWGVADELNNLAKLLCEAITLHGAKMDLELKERLETDCPRLFESPDAKTEN